MIGENTNLEFSSSNYYSKFLQSCTILMVWSEKHNWCKCCRTRGSYDNVSRELWELLLKCSAMLLTQCPEFSEINRVSILEGNVDLYTEYQENSGIHARSLKTDWYPVLSLTISRYSNSSNVHKLRLFPPYLLILLVQNSEALKRRFSEMKRWLLIHTHFANSQLLFFMAYWEAHRKGILGTLFPK